MRSRLDIAKPKISRFFNASPSKVFTRKKLSSVLTTQRADWILPQSLTTSRFVEFLIDKMALIEVRVESAGPYKPISRYVWGDPSPFELGLSLREGSYLSHGTAVQLHGLNDQLPRTVYVNKEQSPKPRGSNLSQESLDRAFTAKQRTSNYIYTYKDSTFVLLSGMYTNDLEVTDAAGPSGEPLRFTKLERTLIDIVVRPFYAGGYHNVLEAFRGAVERASIGTIVATLRKLGYIYPYHQAIGYYAMKAGFPSAQLERLKSLGLVYNFYLTHEIADPVFNEEWKLFVPKHI